MAAPKKYIPQVHDKWAWSLAIKGATDQEIADAFGVTIRTINRWKFVVDASGKPVLNQNREKVLTNFGAMLQNAKESSDAEVEYNLHKRAIGYRTTEVEKIVETDPVTGKQSVTKTRIVEKEVPPDTMAIMYWLNNRSRKSGEWTQRQEVTLDGGIDVKAQDEKVKKMLDSLSDEELKQYEDLCEAINSKT